MKEPELYAEKRDDKCPDDEPLIRLETTKQEGGANVSFCLAVELIIAVEHGSTIADGAPTAVRDILKFCGINTREKQE